MTEAVELPRAVAPNDPKRPAGAAPAGTVPAGVEATLLRAARQFESVFLAEMLRHTGFGRMPDAFNGGAGEAGFSGTLIQEYASRIAEAGGFGVAERIFASRMAHSVDAMTAAPGEAR